MSLWFDILMKLNGYYYIYNIKDVQINQITEEDGEIKDIIITKKNRTLSRMIVNILYIAFIFILHNFIPIFIIYNSIHQNDIREFTQKLTYFIHPTQYYAGIIYFNKNHFTEFIKYSDCNIKRLCILAITLSLITSLISLILLFSTKINITFFRNILTDRTEINFLIGIFILVEKFINHISLITNILVFISIIHHHTEKTRKFYDEFESILSSNITLQSILISFSKLKSEHAQSIQNLNTMFTLLITFSVLSGYFILIYNEISDKILYFIITMSMLCIMIYLYLIHRLKESVGDIKKITNSTNFLSKYINEIEELNLDEHENLDSPKNKFKEIALKLSKKNTYEYQDIKIYMASIINKNLTEWQIINTKLSDDWESFTLFGFDVDDTTIFQRLIFLIGVFFMVQNIPI